MYNKGGLSGLTSETKRHPCVCRLINQLIISTLSTHAWTSISVNMNCGTEVHKDQGNASESDLFSLHIGLSHHQDGQLWVENTAGDMYMEHHKEGLIRGQVYPTSAVANLFHGQQHYHATMPWRGGDRVACWPMLLDSIKAPWINTRPSLKTWVLFFLGSVFVLVSRLCRDQAIFVRNICAVSGILEWHTPGEALCSQYLGSPSTLTYLHPTSWRLGVNCAGIHH